MKAKSFIEVLEQQIRHDLRDELRKQIEAEVRADLDREARKSESQPLDPKSSAFERLETWLASRIERRTFTSETEAKTQARRSYQGRSAGARQDAQDTVRATQDPRPTEQRPPMQKTPPAPQYRAQTVAELCALELLRRYGAKIGDSFTAAELKTAWRKAALQTHPDRFVGADSATQTRMGAIFHEIAHAYEILEALTETSLAA